MRVLIVDDAVDTRKIFAMAFDLHGHSTHLAFNGMDAVAAVCHEAFDAIVMDIAMPGMSGLETIRLIRALPNGQTVPIVILTAWDCDSDTALAAGANELVHKPVRPDTLLLHIQKMQSSLPPKRARI